jgi:hypothetical protein
MRHVGAKVRRQWRQLRAVRGELETGSSGSTRPSISTVSKKTPLEIDEAIDADPVAAYHG